METLDASSACIFCEKFGNMSSSECKWFDTELTSFSSFVVVPALGSFVEGCLMILTRQHYYNMGHLSTTQLAELTILKRKVRDVLTRYYRTPIVFEHGPAVPLGSPAFSVSGGGSCIDHAHFQFFPLEIDLLPLLRMRHAMKPMRNLAELVELSAKGKPYIFFENQQERMYVGEAENVPRQYLRRLIAAELGIPNKWNYAIFPNYELIAATIEKLTPWPSHHLEALRTDS